MHAYVVIASKRGEPVDPKIVARVRHADLPDLVFEPDDHLHWANVNGSVHYLGWQAFTEVANLASHWHATPAGLTAFSGHVWPRYEGWDWQEGNWARQLDRYLSDRDTVYAFEELYGVYSLVRLSREGISHVAPDNLSAGLLYLAETSDLLIVASRAALAARAVTPAGVQPGRDVFGAGWSAFATNPHSPETGFRDVTTLPFGAYLHADPAHGASIRMRRFDYWRFPNDDGIPRDVEGLGLVLEDDLQQTMRTLSQVPAAQRQVRLSGGKDSRLIAALAIGAGVKDRFTFFSFGLPHSPDVLSAQLVAERMGLNWVFEDRSGMPEAAAPALERQMRVHTFQVSGALSGWDMQGSTRAMDNLTLSGNTSELIRLGFSSASTLKARTDHEAIEFMLHARGVKSSLFVRPEAKAHFMAEMRRWIESLLERGIDRQRIGSMRQVEIAARRWVGAGLEVNPRLWTLPLGTTTGMRVVQYLPEAERVTQRFHFDIMRRAHPDLAKLPFAYYGWWPETFAHLPDADDYFQTVHITSGGTQPSHWRIARFEEHRPFFEGFLLDRTSPVYEVLDPDRIAQALRRTPMEFGDIRYLYGALTAAIWLSGSEWALRINREGEDRPAPALPKTTETPPQIRVPHRGRRIRPDRTQLLRLSAASHVPSDGVSTPENPPVQPSEELPPQRGRLALVANAFPMTSETFIADRFLHLLARGWDAYIVALREDHRAWVYYPEIANEPLLRDRVIVERDPTAVFQSLRPDLVHFEFGPLARGRLAACRQGGARSLVSFRGYDIAFEGLDDPFYYDEVWQEADAIHAVSHDLWQRCIDRGCPPQKDHAVVLDASDPEFFDPGERRHSGELGTPERPLRVLSVGRLVWKKGHEFGLQAIRELHDLGVNVEYRIVGDGDLWPMLRYTSELLGVSQQVTFVGRATRAEVRQEMLDADVLLHPSLSEGFSVSVIEAQAMRLPVVCSDAEGLPENICHGVTGYVTRRRDVLAMAERLAMLAADPALRESMGQAGRQRVLDHLTLDRQIDAFETLYARLLSPRLRAMTLYTGLVDEQPIPPEGDLGALLRLETRFMEAISS